MRARVPSGPSRIVCLTEDPTEILYALGEGDRVVGISAYTVRPPEARRDKPVVSAFVGGSVDRICALKPDLVVGFSDVQANLARELISANLTVLILNQRSIDEILGVVLMLGRIVGASERAQELVDGYLATLDAAAARPAAAGARPRVYFEEWDEPTISGIQWVSELIELTGAVGVGGRGIVRATDAGDAEQDKEGSKGPMGPERSDFNMERSDFTMERSDFNPLVCHYFLVIFG